MQRQAFFPTTANQWKLKRNDRKIITTKFTSALSTGIGLERDRTHLLIHLNPNFMTWKKRLVIVV
jgi:hypothetical protein